MKQFFKKDIFGIISSIWRAFVQIHLEVLFLEKPVKILPIMNNLKMILKCGQIIKF